MTRMVLHLCMVFTLAIGNLHSPSMFHAEEAHHADHIDSDHSELAANSGHDVERGTLAHDHHVPTAMTATLPRIDTPMAPATGTYRLSNSAALASWSTAPPPEPPAA